MITDTTLICEPNASATTATAAPAVNGEPYEDDTDAGDGDNNDNDNDDKGGGSSGGGASGGSGGGSSGGGSGGGSSSSSSSSFKREFTAKSDEQKAKALMQLLMQDEALRVSLESDDQVCVCVELLLISTVICIVRSVARQRCQCRH
jgi:hypothetical protein